jgi:hypothetical protein
MCSGAAVEDESGRGRVLNSSVFDMIEHGYLCSLRSQDRCGKQGDIDDDQCCLSQALRWTEESRMSIDGGKSI